MTTTFQDARFFAKNSQLFLPLSAEATPESVQQVAQLFASKGAHVDVTLQENVPSLRISNLSEPPLTILSNLKPYLQQEAYNKVAQEEQTREAEANRRKGPVEWFRHQLRTKTLQTLGALYTVGDLLGFSMGIVNSVNMVKPVGGGDYVFGATNFAGSVAMMGWGNRETGKTNADAVFDKIMSGLEGNPLAEAMGYSSASTPRTAKQALDSHLMRNAEYYQQLGNVISAGGMAASAIEQKNPITGMQALLLSTGYAGPILIPQKGVEHRFDYAEFGNKTGLTHTINSLQDSWIARIPGVKQLFSPIKKVGESLHENPRQTIALASMHNVLGFFASGLDVWRSPKEKASIIEEFDNPNNPDPRYMPIEVNSDGSVAFDADGNVKRIGNWRKLSTPQLRDLIAYTQDGWLATDEQGRPRQLTDEERGHVSRLPADAANNVTLEDGSKLHRLSSPMNSHEHARFEKAIQDYQMYERLPISAALKFVMVSFYFSANVMYSFFKGPKQELDVSELYTRAAMEILKPPTQETPEGMMASKTMLLDYLSNSIANRPEIAASPDHRVTPEEAANKIIEAANKLQQSPAANLLPTPAAVHGIAQSVAPTIEPSQDMSLSQSIALSQQQSQAQMQAIGREESANFLEDLGRRHDQLLH